MIPSNQAKLVALALAALVAGAVVLLLVSGGSDGGAHRAPAAQPSAAAQVRVNGGGANADERPSGPLQLAKRGHPIVWVRIGKEVEVRTGPGGGEAIRTVGARTEFESRRVFSVVRAEHGWAGVSTPLAGNGELGWVKLDSAKLRAGWLPNEIVVDLSSRRAELIHGDKVLRTFPVTVGAPTSPTPTGRFAVTDTFRGNLNAAYGCCALALSAIQPALPSGWLGGNRIAIHGTPGAIGAAISHGCVRAPDADVSALVSKAPPGTPVLIRQ
jgi:hypothetical protein